MMLMKSRDEEVLTESIVRLQGMVGKSEEMARHIIQ
jgi:hypothetical protein